MEQDLDFLRTKGPGSDLSCNRGQVCDHHSWTGNIKVGTCLRTKGRRLDPSCSRGPRSGPHSWTDKVQGMGLSLLGPGTSRNRTHLVRRDQERRDPSGPGWIRI